VKLLTYAQTLHDLNVIKENGIEEVILGHRDFARFGKLDDEAFSQTAARARELGLKIIFEWDILMTEKIFAARALDLIKHLESFDILRVQDPGALEWSLEHTNKALQFIAENGNHNLKALQGWGDYAGARLQRIVLSMELSKAMIEEYISALSVPCELLGLGRILLFYTPRSLLSPLSTEKLVQNQELAAVGESEESPHRGFPIVENRHGTFMFHIKEFCLMDFALELKAMGLHTMRIDLRWESLSYLPEVVRLTESAATVITFKENYPQDLMRGFYLVNKTDVLFPKLKNHRLQKREGDYIGEVIEAEKGSHLAIVIKNPRGLKKTDRLKIVHPKGSVFEVDIYSLRDVALEEVQIVSVQKLAIIQYVGGVWAKSQVFYLN
jgi:U32 family peptidase